ncbi:serine-rich adhesin for platelets-like isoform X2 [Corticium candelabrum]|uniref:serine-rich adhesin for platelets-like isoform X2 n=1 Tax=Corticium candelabrum TaxID=121492 RepID=UPI002E2650E0|nr:serine-rich adhesin for platelets-like isoform X2 [Corticium candelabrum]
MMGKPKPGGTIKDGRQLLGSETESEVQEFPLPPRRPSRMRSKKSGSHHSDLFCRDFLRIVIVLVVLAMMAAIGFLGFVYYKLNGEMEKLMEEYVKVKGDWTGEGPMARMLQAAAKSVDLNQLTQRHDKDWVSLKGKFQLIHNHLITVNSTVSDLRKDAKQWAIVLDSTSQLQKVGGNVDGLTQEVTKMVSNVERIDRDLADMKKSISVLKRDSSESTNKLTTLDAGFNSVKGDVQTHKSKIDELEHSSTKLQQRTGSLVSINVTEMDLTMQQMSHEMSRVVEAIDLLQATAHHGNDSLGLKPVLAKLDVIKQGVLSSQAHSESLKRRLTAVEKIEAQHQDDIDSLTSTVSQFNSSLFAMMIGSQMTTSLMEQQMHNFTLRIGAQLQQYLSSVLGMIKSGNHKSSNLSSLIGATVNRVVVSMKDEIQRTTGIFLEGMNMLQATILLQNETITTLQHEIQRVSTSVWRLRAEVTAEKLANKHVEPTDDKPKLPTETKNKTASLVTEMTNQTTTEAALDDIPVAISETVSDEPVTTNSNTPLQGNTAGSGDIITTDTVEETKVVTISPLTTKQTELAEHKSTTASGHLSTTTPEVAVQEQATFSSPLNSAGGDSVQGQATPSVLAFLPTETITNMSDTLSPNGVSGNGPTEFNRTEASGSQNTSNINISDVTSGSKYEMSNITLNDTGSAGVQFVNNSESVRPAKPSEVSSTVTDNKLKGQNFSNTDSDHTDQHTVSQEEQDSMAEAVQELSDLDELDTPNTVPEDHNMTTATNEGAAANVPAKPLFSDEILKDEMKLLQTFDELDKDKDGKLSYQELLSVIPKNMEDQLAAIDVDSDEYFTKEELSEAVKEAEVSFQEDEDS